VELVEWVNTQPKGQRVRSKQHLVELTSSTRTYCGVTFPHKDARIIGLKSQEPIRACSHCHRIEAQNEAAKMHAAGYGRSPGRPMGRPVRRRSSSRP
jgi:hypothetical protein